MGGFGSGRRWSKKRVAEDCCAIDAAGLKRMGLLAPGTADRPGTLEWRVRGLARPSSSVSYTLTVGETEGTLRLRYELTRSGETFDYPVPLVTTPCRFGGVRWWLVCPLVLGEAACRRRVRKVYLCGRYFGCRHCHRLTYTSTQESDRRVYAALRGGPNLDRYENPSGMSVAELGIALKVFALEQKRIDRVLKRPLR